MASPSESASLMAPWPPLWRPDQPIGDVKEQDTADRLQAGDAEQQRCQGGEDDAQADGAGAAKDDRLAPVLSGEAAGGHADNDGVVAGEDEIDDDDADDRGD